MDQREYLLVQQIIHEKSGEELDLSWLKEATYIETIDLSGPKLILRMNDHESLLRDDLALTEKDQLIVTLADPYQLDGLDIQETFVIETMPVDSDEIITLNCLPKVIHELKQPAKTAQFFVNSSITGVIQPFIPAALVADPYPSTSTYHLLPAMRPSRLIRQAAKEAGVQVFYRRGEVVCKPLSSLMKAEASFEYHYNDESQDHQIASYKQISASTLIDDRMKRHYQGWSLTEGPVHSRVLDGEPMEQSGLDTVIGLDHLNRLPLPVLDMYCLGNGGLRAGDTLDLVWNRMNIEMPLDESLPNKIIIGTVAHQYCANRYRCRIKGVVEYGL